ncbi:glycosyltransferase family 1 protein [Pigmentiphaga sp.]|uniref:glycosyltransferase family 4 protein n=1 Tax=Pigmentiphaga sp. TaxID=1977564 RepID=UPI0025F9C2C9|nr:glycosyltransferase family 1 protein [Pigmentiphaga sp.]
MRIGVDARPLLKQVTGIGRYTVELLRELQRLEQDIFLYAPERFARGSYNYTNVHARTACPVRGRVAKTLWAQTVLPYLVTRDGVDVFWGAAHRLPPLLSRSCARVVTIHDLVWKHAGETMRMTSRLAERVLMPGAVRQADLIMANSQSTANDIEEEFPAARGKVRVVYPGTALLARPESAAALSTLGVRLPYCLFVGTLEPRKNLRRLLGAFASLPDADRRGTQLVVVGGNGWGGVDVPSLLRELHLEADVAAIGYVSDTQLSTLYAHARFVAMPSLYEGFGFPLVEAMSFGVPVLTSRASSMPEVAADAGVIVDPLDEADIAAGMQRLLIDDALHQSLAIRAQANAARFSWDKTAREALEVFAEARRIRGYSRAGR